MSRRDDSVFSSLQQVTGATYDNAAYNKDLLDVYLLRKARQSGVRLPTGGPPDEYKYLGAFVEQPTAGMNENVVYCDLASLYPNTLRTLNMSFETIIGTEDDLRASEYTEDECVSGWIDPRPVKHLAKGEPWQQYTDGRYKMVYDPHAPQIKWTCDDAEGTSAGGTSSTTTSNEAGGPQYEKCYFLAHDVREGFVTECVQELIDLKNRYRGTSLYAATKRVVNSIYGVLAFATEDSSFRLFDWRIGEATTLTGRKIIQYSRDQIVQWCHDNGFPDAYACSGDTDATAVALPSAATRHEAMEAVAEAVEWLNEEGYTDFLETHCNVDPQNNYQEIEIESFSPRLFIPSQDPPHDPVGVKKRYITWETWNDDDGETDEVSLTGLEAERSDIAPITRQAQEAFAETLRVDDRPAREQLFPRLREWADAIKSGEIALDRICKRKGIGQPLHEYGTTTRTPQPIYRGAKYATEHIDGVTIQRGDKPMVVYVTDVPEEYPRTYTATTGEEGDLVDAVTVPRASELPEGFAINYEKHFEKTLKEPLKPLLDTRFGADTWSEIIHQHEQQGLDAFEEPA